MHGSKNNISLVTLPQPHCQTLCITTIVRALARQTPAQLWWIKQSATRNKWELQTSRHVSWLEGGDFSASKVKLKIVNDVNILFG